MPVSMDRPNAHLLRGEDGKGEQEAVLAWHRSARRPGTGLRLQVPPADSTLHSPVLSRVPEYSEDVHMPAHACVHARVHTPPHPHTRTLESWSEPASSRAPARLTGEMTKDNAAQIPKVFNARLRRISKHWLSL